MQIVETTNEGLKRAYTLTIPARDIEARIDAEIKKVAPQVKMPGFRPGKVPANLVRKMHGEAIHADTLNTALRESVDTLLRDKQLRPALQPKIDMAEGYEQGKDAELTVELEVLPDIAAPSIEGLTLEKLTVPATDEAVDAAIRQLADRQKSYTDAPEGHAAEDGNQLIIDFVGSIDGVEFEGGKAEDQPLVIGAGQFIPGFEEQLSGAKAGEEKTITVTFPADYPAENLKGKDAEFAITVRAVKVESETVIDDEFAKNFGLEGIDKLKELMKAQVEQETAGLTRTQMKRQLLDRLAADHDFAVPPSMVEAEFNQIWQQLEAEIAREDDPEAARAEIEAEKDDYHRIAERRVRLGLLLSEIGQANGVEISQQEMGMLVQQAAQQYRPQDRERFVEFVRNDPMALAQLRAPLYEDKVVDFLFDKAEITEREVTREELEAAIEAEEGASAGAAESGETAEGAEDQPAAKAAKKKAAKKDDAAGEEPAAAEAEAEPEAQAEAEAQAEPEAEGTSGEAEAGAEVKSAPKKKAPAKKAAKPAAEEGEGEKPAKKPPARKAKKPAEEQATEAGE